MLLIIIFKYIDIVQIVNRKLKYLDVHKINLIHRKCVVFVDTCFRVKNKICNFFKSNDMNVNPIICRD